MNDAPATKPSVRRRLRCGRRARRVSWCSRSRSWRSCSATATRSCSGSVGLGRRGRRRLVGRHRGDAAAGYRHRGRHRRRRLDRTAGIARGARRRRSHRVAHRRSSWSLLAITLASAHAAPWCTTSISSTFASDAGGPPRHAVLLCNPWSGGGKVEQFGLVDARRASSASRRCCSNHGLDLEQLARDAVARGADCLGMAGGDGSQALVASIAVEHRLAVRVRERRNAEPLRARPRTEPRRSARVDVRVPRRHRAARRLRDRQRPVLRQQRVARRVRADRAGGVVPRREVADDEGRSSPRCSAARRSRSIFSSRRRTASRSTARSS